MSNHSKASMEAKIKNSRDLLISVAGYERYKPASAEIKVDNYKEFMDTVESTMTDLNESRGALTSAKKDNSELVDTLVNTAREIRSLTAELKGKNSSEYNQVSNLVRQITGENISRHKRKADLILKELKEGDPQPEFNSVSGLDVKTRLGKFRELIGLLKYYTFYVPEDPSLSIESLEIMRDELTGSLEIVAQKETAFTNHRGKMIDYLNGTYGLTDRARRAKMHVKRKYGIASPQYKALIKKAY